MSNADGKDIPEPFGPTYARLWQQRRRVEWQAYAEDLPGLGSAVDAALFRSASKASFAGDEPDASLLERVRRRVLVDHHPDVVRLRDRIDDPSTYGPVPERPGREWRLELAAAMEPDVVTLIGLRNSLARDLGAASYGHLAMAAEGLDFETIAARMSALRDATLAAGRRFADGAGVTMASWFDGLARFSGRLSGGASDPVASAQELAGRIGCADLLERVRWTVRDGPLAGFAAPLSIPDDVRILVRPARSFHDLATVWHELGHALAYAGTRATGIRAVPSDTQDETMGEIVGRIGVALMVHPDVRSRLDAIAAAETSRTTTSFLFEVAIQDDPSRAREAFVEWFEPLAPVPDPVLWALDSFRSLDPFRIHAYALGGDLAGAVLTHLRATFGDDHRSWGAWLRDELWAAGRRETFADLAGGVPGALWPPPGP